MKDFSQMKLAQLRAEARKDIVGYNVDLVSDNGERQSLNCPVAREETAQLVAKEISKMFTAKPHSVEIPMERKRKKIRLNAEERRIVQHAALALDKGRAVKFIEDVHVLNMLCRMLVMTYDDMTFFFDDLTPMAIKQTITNIERDTCKLLDAVMCLMVFKNGDEKDEHGRTVQENMDAHLTHAAAFLRERFTLVVNYFFSDDWRLPQLDEKLSALLTDEELERMRTVTYEGVRQKIV